MMSKISKFLWSFLGVALFGFLIFVIVMFSTGKWSIRSGLENFFDDLVGYEEYDKVVETDNIYCDDNVSNILSKGDTKVITLNEFSAFNIEDGIMNSTPFTNFSKSELTMFFDNYYTMYRFTYLSDYYYYRGEDTLTNVYILCYRNIKNQDRVSYNISHNEIIAFGNGFVNFGSSNYFGENSIFGTDFKTHDGKENSVNNDLYKFKGYNVFDILKSFAIATMDENKLNVDKMTTSQGYAQLKFPFVFGNENELFKINASAICNVKGPFIDHFMTYNRTGILHEDVIPGIRNDISESVYQEIYKGGKHATNIILTSSPVNLVKNADCTYL